MRWGGPEATTDQQGVKAFHELFVAAAAAGITVCVASGDHGTADMASPDWDQKIHVDHPAVDDLVLGCGGTQIDAGGKDVAWNDGSPFDVNVPGGGGWAGGGGMRTGFAVPSLQAGAGVPVSMETGEPSRAGSANAISAAHYFIHADSSPADSVR